MKRWVKISSIAIGSIVILGLVYYFFGWESNPNIKLHNLIKDADKILIKTVSNKQSSIVGQITNPAEIKDFIFHLEAKKNMVGEIYGHGCYGDYDFVFYKGNNIITTVNIGHGDYLKWTDGWDSDHKVTNDCRKYLESKFKEMGLALKPR